MRRALSDPPPDEWKPVLWISPSSRWTPAVFACQSAPAYPLAATTAAYTA